MKLLSDYIGCNAEALLESLPFRNWEVERSTEEDLEQPIIQYEFPGRSIALRCDSNNHITSIFLRRYDLDGFDLNSLDVSFAWDRVQVRKVLGAPTQTGDPVSDPILGEYGPWDKYKFEGYSMHLEYEKENSRVRRITIMK